MGGGLWGREIAQTYKENCKGFIDNNNKLWGKDIQGIPVFSPDILMKTSDNSKVLITTRLYYKEIKKQLLDMGIAEERIINIGEIQDAMMGKEYFDLPQLPHCENESFVDAGSLDGMNALGFVRWSGNFSHIYSLEPDSDNVKKCEKTLASYIAEDKASIINAAAWSEKTMLHFKADGYAGSCVSDNSGIDVEADAIDNMLAGRRVSFIKMDIEGAELHALYGAKRIICEQKPKLAISVYHKPQDIISLPDFILSLNPSYKLYLRHYTLVQWDTVLYAVP